MKPDAGRLHESGEPVCILARGQRWAQLRQHGLILQEVHTRELRVCRVTVVEVLHPEDAYDLIVVAVRKNQVASVLPELAANCRSPERSGRSGTGNSDSKT
jgi:2-dehydropantoate 2-reductase